MRKPWRPSLNPSRAMPPESRRDWPVAPGAPAGWRRTYSSLQIPGYRWLWFGMLAYFMAMQMDTVARGYLAYDLTGSATALGVVTIAWGLPMLLLSLVGGAVADRVEKRNLLLFAQVAMALVALTTALLVQTGVVQIWHLVMLGVAQGSTWSFIVPARQALVPELVGEDELANALALNNSAINVTRIAGPSVAGGLIAIPLVGLPGVFYLMVFLYALVVLTLLRVPTTGRAAGREVGPILQEIGIGVRYVTGRSALMVLLGLAFVAVLLGMPYSTLLPVFAEDVHHVGSVGLGLMSTFVGVGAILGSLVIAYFSNYPGRATVQLMLGMGFGLGLFLFGGAPTFVLALAALSLMGFMIAGYMTLNNTLIFIHAERRFHGRVMSVYMLTWSLMPLSALPMTALADVVGAQAVMAAAGILVFVVIASVGIFYSGYRELGAVATSSVPAEGRDGI